jgi:Type IV pilin-like G and H, putative
MKTLLRCTTLFCLSISLGTPALGQPTSSPSIIQTQPSIVGSWSMIDDREHYLMIFNSVGEVNVLLEQVYGDYKYYKTPTSDENSLINQVANASFKPEPPLKYRVKGNLLTVTTRDGTDDTRRLVFTANGRSFDMIQDDVKSSFTFNRVSDSIEMPNNSESLATAESQFHGLSKLVALQTAQTKYWQKQRRFSPKIHNLSFKALLESDRLYNYRILQVTQRQSTIVAIPKQPSLRSYVMRIDRIGRQNKLFTGILCATDRPSQQLTAVVQLPNNQQTCPAKTHNINLPSRLIENLSSVTPGAKVPENKNG